MSAPAILPIANQDEGIRLESLLYRLDIGAVRPILHRAVLLLNYIFHLQHLIVRDKRLDRFARRRPGKLVERRRAALVAPVGQKPRPGQQRRGRHAVTRAIPRFIEPSFLETAPVIVALEDCLVFRRCQIVLQDLTVPRINLIAIRRPPEIAGIRAVDEVPVIASPLEVVLLGRLRDLEGRGGGAGVVARARHGDGVGAGLHAAGLVGHGVPGARHGGAARQGDRRDARVLHAAVAHVARLRERDRGARDVDGLRLPGALPRPGAGEGGAFQGLDLGSRGDRTATRQLPLAGVAIVRGRVCQAHRVGQRRSAAACPVYNRDFRKVETRTELDGRQIRTAGEHVASRIGLVHVGRNAVMPHCQARSVEARNVNGGKGSTAFNKTGHAFHRRSVEGVQVERFERIALDEHAIHQDGLLGVEIAHIDASQADAAGKHRFEKLDIRRVHVADVELFQA